MQDDFLAQHAYKLLKASKEYLDDARVGAAVDNTVIGSLMALQFQAPRWATEWAVKTALVRISAERRKRKVRAQRTKMIIEKGKLKCVRQNEH